MATCAPHDRTLFGMAGPLSADELAHMAREGWVLARGLLPPQVLAAVQAEIEAVVDEAAEQLFAKGKLVRRPRPRYPRPWTVVQGLDRSTYNRISRWGSPIPGAAAPRARLSAPTPGALHAVPRDQRNGLPWHIDVKVILTLFCIFCMDNH